LTTLSALSLVTHTTWLTRLKDKLYNVYLLWKRLNTLAETVTQVDFIWNVCSWNLSGTSVLV